MKKSIFGSFKISDVTRYEIITLTCNGQFNNLVRALFCMSSFYVEIVSHVGTSFLGTFSRIFFTFTFKLSIFF